ncbi:Hypothetical predicted protein [Marmota monax]|uniref:Uncharacterized protein n=1 Tax=Marmota monax TaxID=9995 RepID=A0A5E4AAR5_MARMO|nr:Hypothetical predicted protein [Marmota monax]
MRRSWKAGRSRERAGGALGCGGEQAALGFRRRVHHRDELERQPSAKGESRKRRLKKTTNKQQQQKQLIALPCIFLPGNEAHLLGYFPISHTWLSPPEGGEARAIATSDPRVATK